MTQGSFQRSFLAHYKDLRGIYAKRMECHGNGMALMQPVSGEDCQPVCCGYFDRNGNWNLITSLIANDQLDVDDFFEPLEYLPLVSNDVEITWQPKTSLGTMAVTVDASGQTPNGLPGGAGADVHIQYTSNTKFGAVLMTTAPVRLRAYNDEALFASWLSRNKTRLYQRYGPELKKYGMWIVTRTYTTQRASINAWLDKDKTSIVSLKAKAAMLGELGEDLDWKDKALSKDWTMYQAKTDLGVVVFMDGIEVGPIDWWLEGIRSSMQSSDHLPKRYLSNYIPDPIQHQATTPLRQSSRTKSLLRKPQQNPPQLGEPSAEPRRPSRLAGAGPRRKSESDTRRVSPHSGSNVTEQTPGSVDEPPQAGSVGYEESHRLPPPAPQPGFGQSTQSSHQSGPEVRRPSQALEPNTQPPHQSTQPNTRTTQLPTYRKVPNITQWPGGLQSQRPANPQIVSQYSSQHSSSPRPQDHIGSPQEPFLARPRDHSGSLSLPPIRRIRNASDEIRPVSMVADEDILHDAGVSSVSRSQSLRRASVSSSIRTPSMTQSIRRGPESIHEEKELGLAGQDDKSFDFFSRDMVHDMQMGMPPELR